MRSESGLDISALLRKVNADDREAFAALVPLVYGQLRRLAHNQLRGERSDHTLNTTALAHEAYLELVDVSHESWQDRAHFLAAASRVMRHVLVDHARARNAKKRGGEWVRVELEPDLLPLEEEYAKALEELDGASGGAEPPQSEVAGGQAISHEEVERRLTQRLNASLEE